MMESFTNNHCLHLVASSRTDASARCHAVISEGDAVLFIGDGVMHALDPEKKYLTHFPNCLFSKVDLEARAVLPTTSGLVLKTVSDLDFVDLLKQFDHCLTWK
jgi:sulfur relay protein TusB/DsrH